MELILYFSGVVLLALAAFFLRKKSLQITVTSIFGIWQILFTIFLVKNINKSWFEYFFNDNISLILTLLLTITSIAALINTFVYFEYRNEKALVRSIYLSSIMILMGCMTGVFLSNNAGLMWILAEATTLAIAVLIYHERNNEALEATWKYVFVSTIGLSFSFIGIILLDMSLLSGTEMTLFFNQINETITITNKLLFQIAFVLIVIGFSIKMEIYPLHTVCVDANSIAPAPVSAIISTSLANVGFLAIFRFYKIAASTELHNWAGNILLILGTLSILYAAVYMMRVKNYRRLVAYSSIEHLGLVSLGIATGGIAWIAAILHIIYHSLIKSSLFFQLSQFYKMFKTHNIIGIKGYFKINPFGGIVVLLSIILILGIPPSGLFFTELLLFKTMYEKGLLWLVIIILILLTLIIWIVIKQFFRMLFSNILEEQLKSIKKVKWYESLPQFILLLIALYFSINPPEYLLSFIQQGILP